MFSKILIANRGEIAVRIMSTARTLGIRTVAVYSDADRDALHTRTADEAVHIGPPAPAASYLVIEKIIDAAKQTGAEAIHPGYGFLSENADFAEACEKAGIVFIGPGVNAIRTMGSKSLSKDLMVRAKVPVAPGYQGEDQSLETFKAEARRIGYPVLLKASAGGGGKGMRLVEKASDLEASLESAKREAKSAFGDERFLIEKFITSPRHVEVQIFGDTHGSVVHLFERDCTVQRRHQKVIEEAPAPNLPDNVRSALHKAAIEAAKTVDYVGAGTVEFLYDQSSNEVYFMEMNTRLQVEHPVTEEVTGIDLVAWQLGVAAGEPLPLKQDEIACHGHAFEARLYAENPEAGFLPSTGMIEFFSTPAGLDDVRLDLGVEEGGEVTSHYDPMIGKLITYGEDRAAALGRLKALLVETRIAGPDTNTRFLHAIASHAQFENGEFDTGFIEANEKDLFRSSGKEVVAQAAALLWIAHFRAETADDDPWSSIQGFRTNAPRVHRLEIDIDGERQILLLEISRSEMTISVGDARTPVSNIAAEDHQIRFDMDGQSHVATVFASMDAVFVWLGADKFTLPVWRMDFTSDGAGGSLAAPMPGVVTALPLAAGCKAKKGEILIVMEAMKMEHPIEAPSDGTLVAHRFQVGDQLQQGDILVDFEADEV